MQACQVMISTKADGTGNEIIREGEMDIFPRSANLVYREENALVKLSLHDAKAEIVREGDYTLSLFLESGKTTKGTIGINGNNGEILTKTHAVEYKIAENYVVTRLAYDLLIGTEKQEMELRLLAKIK
ncbi:MAG: DUF1934 family protein [Clostridia bacterium]|nr:DUF1934 family protein [Clostridia bacterium]